MAATPYAFPVSRVTARSSASPRSCKALAMHNAPASSVSIDMSVSKMILVGDMKSAVRRPVRPDVDMCTLHADTAAVVLVRDLPHSM